MADNVAITAGSGTSIATDDIGGVHHQKVKLEFGVADSATLVSATDPLPVTVSNTNANGQATMANSSPVVLASNQSPVSVKAGQGEYEAVAASATNQALGATGASGDYLSHVIVIPATTSPGAVTIKDNTTAVISIASGTVPSIIPYVVYVGAYSSSGAWNITTGTNVACFAVGDFT